MQKRHLFSLAAALLLLAALILFLAIYSGNQEPCTSMECVKTASELLTHLDPSAPPCNDFYAFACGNVINARNRNDSQVRIDQVRNAKINQIRQMIEEPSSNLDGKDLLIVKEFYHSCLNETAIEEAGLRPMREILQKLGGWPMLERGNWRADRYNWTKAISVLRSFGMDFDLFMKITVTPNRMETTKHIINIAPGKHTEVKDKYAYLEFMVSVSLLFGADRNRAERESREVIEFENLLRKTSGIHAQDIKYADLYNPRTLTQMQYDYPAIPWVDYINGVLFPSASVTSDEVVNVLDLEYIREFLSLLDRTPKRITSNYIWWHVMQHYVPYLPKRLRDLKARYEKNTIVRTRKDVCLDIVLESLPRAVETSYVRGYVSDEARRITKDIIDYIKKEFNNILDDLDWLDEDAKEVAREKLASTQDFIAYTQEAPSGKKLEQNYDEVLVVGNHSDFLELIKMVESMHLNEKYGKLSEPVYEESGGKLMYSITRNTLSLPSYYLQGLFFDARRPQYMNYGGLGSIIADQLSKLFLEGRRYDLYGNLREWSTSQSLFNYSEKVKCVRRQYEELNGTGAATERRNVSSALTEEDDVAILFGKRIARGAYRKWSESHDREQKLPGLIYTAEQLFWISSAVHECKERDGRTKVLGAMRNLDEFANDFGCASESYMHPKNKCLLW